MSALDQVIAGFHAFHDSTYTKNKAFFQQLAQGQKPKAMMICCSDSRVDPALITSAAPGDLFVMRNVANLVPPYEPDGGRHGTSAALEFAVKSLQIGHIVVMGHSQCGGVNALLTADPENDPGLVFINRWMAIAHSARERTLAFHTHDSFEVQCRFCEQEVVRISLANLITFPWIREQVAAGRLELRGWYFDLGDGRLHQWEPNKGVFVPL